MMSQGAPVILVCVGVTCIGLLTSAKTSPYTSSACYSSGGACGDHSLNCDHGVISITDMRYGFKNQSIYESLQCSSLINNCDKYVSRTSCCNHDVTSDCFVLYLDSHQLAIKSNCNGQPSCKVRAEHSDGSCSNPPNVYGTVSSYSVISYVCANVTHRSTNQVTPCQDGCDITTSPLVPDDTTDGSNDSESDKDEHMQQLIIGVSIGLGSGFLFLLLILCVCWVRIRRKPIDMLSVRSIPSISRPSLSRSPSKAHTLTSTMPSSHYSSFFYSDTLPSSHPGSIYPESIYTLPVESTPGGSIGPASVLRAGESSSDEGPVMASLTNGHYPLPGPAPSRTDGSGLPPQLPKRASILKTISNGVFERHSEMNGELPAPVQEQKADFNVSSRPLPVNSEGDNARSTPKSRADSSNARSSKRSGSTGQSRRSASHTSAPGPRHSSLVSKSSSGSASSPKEWWQLPASQQGSLQGDPVFEEPPVLEEDVVRELPVAQSQDKQEAVESWLCSIRL